MITGCVINPIENTVELAALDIPERWCVEDITSGDTANWIEDLGDPLLAPLIEQAIDHSFLLKAGLSRMAQMEASVRLQGVLKYPVLGIDLTHGVQENFSEILGAVKTDINSLMLSSSWEIDLWGTIRKQQSASYAQLEAVGYDYADLLLSIRSRIAKTWFSAVEARLQYELAVETRDSYKRNLNTLESRYLAGLVDAFDLRLFRAHTAANEAIVSQLASQMEAVLRQLQTMLGHYPNGIIQLSDSLPVIEKNIPSSLPSELLQRRPDLRASERQLAASLGSRDAANKNWLPSIRLTGSYGTTSGDFADLLDGSRLLTSLLGGITAPLFQGGSLKAKRELSEAKYYEQVQLYSYSVLEAFREVETALINETLLATVEEKLSFSVTEIKKAEALAWDLYHHGLRDITAVLDTQRSSVNAQSQYLAIQNKRIQNRIDLHVALGGDFYTHFELTDYVTPL